MRSILNILLGTHNAYLAAQLAQTRQRDMIAHKLLIADHILQQRSLALLEIEIGNINQFETTYRDLPMCRQHVGELRNLFLDHKALLQWTPSSN